eukprot:476818-Rhodomonas_salina.2
MTCQRLRQKIRRDSVTKRSRGAEEKRSRGAEEQRKDGGAGSEAERSGGGKVRVVTRVSGRRCVCERDRVHAREKLQVGRLAGSRGWETKSALKSLSNLSEFRLVGVFDGEEDVRWDREDYIPAAQVLHAHQTPAPMEHTRR